MYLAFRQVLRDCLVIRWVECGSPRWPAHRAAQSVAPSPSPLDSVWLASGLCLCSCESLPQVEDPRALRGGHLDCRGTRPRSDYHPVRWCFLRPMRCAVVVSPVWEVAPFKIHVQEGGVLTASQTQIFPPASRTLVSFAARSGHARREPRRGSCSIAATSRSALSSHVSLGWSENLSPGPETSW
eukprot:1195610-Prorocentrum_minimum.AAC.3